MVDPIRQIVAMGRFFRSRIHALLFLLCVLASAGCGGKSSENANAPHNSVHLSGWVTGHDLDARRDMAGCQTCHGPDSILSSSGPAPACLSCHVRSPVSFPDNCISCHGENMEPTRVVLARDGRTSPLDPTFAAKAAQGISHLKHDKLSLERRQVSPSCSVCHAGYARHKHHGSLQVVAGVVCADCHGGIPLPGRTNPAFACTDCHGQDPWANPDHCVSCHGSPAGPAVLKDNPVLVDMVRNKRLHLKHDVLTPAEQLPTDQVCGSCHPDYRTHPHHGSLNSPNPPACLSCHANIPLPTRTVDKLACTHCHNLDPQLAGYSSKCRSCHASPPTHAPVKSVALQNLIYTANLHRKHDVLTTEEQRGSDQVCSSCHIDYRQHPHHAILKRVTPPACYDCHGVFPLPTRQVAGLICTDCHAGDPRDARYSSNCISCHGYPVDHAPLKNSGLSSIVARQLHLKHGVLTSQEMATSRTCRKCHGQVENLHHNMLDPRDKNYRADIFCADCHVVIGADMTLTDKCSSLNCHPGVFRSP